MPRRNPRIDIDTCPSAADIMEGTPDTDIKFAVCTPNGDYHVYDSWADVLDDSDAMTDGDTLEVVKMLGVKTIRTAALTLED